MNQYSRIAEHIGIKELSSPQETSKVKVANLRKEIELLTISDKFFVEKYHYSQNYQMATINEPANEQQPTEVPHANKIRRDWRKRVVNQQLAKRRQMHQEIKTAVTKIKRCIHELKAMRFRYESPIKEILYGPPCSGSRPNVREVAESTRGTNPSPTNNLIKLNALIVTCQQIIADEQELFAIVENEAGTVEYTERQIRLIRFEKNLVYSPVIIP